MYYQLKYPAPGSPHLAKRVKELLIGSGFNHVDEDKKRGLDHGAWIPLLLMYPEEITLFINQKRCYFSLQHGKSIVPS